jgi:SAM-dependent methyltransferase
LYCLLPLWDDDHPAKAPGGDAVVTQDSDAGKVAAFAEQVLAIINGGFLSIMLGLGHRTGLFDVLSGLAPSTSAEIAEASALHERYVREWLGAMVVGRIVDYDPETARYSLPLEHAAVLTRAAGSDNMALFAEVVPQMAPVYDQIVECFKHGGGVPYAKFPHFHGYMRELSAPSFEATLLEKTLPLVDGLVQRLAEGIAVLDAGCGGGHACAVLARRFPRSRFVGYDFEPEAIEMARTDAQDCPNARFGVVDLAQLHETEKYDMITAFDTVHDQAQPRRVLANLYRALRGGGTFLMVDVAASSRLEDNVGNPLAPFVYSASVMHCMTVSLAQGGEGLGMAWGEQKALELLAEAGFQDVAVKRLENDPYSNYYTASKP